MSDIGIPPHPDAEVRQTLVFPGTARPRRDTCQACRFYQGVAVGLAFSVVVYAIIGYAIYKTFA